MESIVEDYQLLAELKEETRLPMGDSASPKGIIYHIAQDNSKLVKVLDIGFGTGGLGRIIKSNIQTQHWIIDGIDGWSVNCLNKNLIEEKIYRNIWCGLAQELPGEIISNYDIICLLDVIEHLDCETAKWLLRFLLSSMGENSSLFISTPLWYYPQNQQQDGDLEEHLIGIPATSMFSLIPIAYSISPPLIGGFVYRKESLKYIDFFQPTPNKKFSYEMGMRILKSINMPAEPGVVYKVN